MRHIVRKPLTRATTLLQTSSQSKVFRRNYGPPKFWELQFREFWDSNLGVLGQNDIWVLVPWLGTKYTISGKVVTSPKSRLCWVLWVRVCPWFVRAPKCSNYALINLLFGFCRSVWIIELLINLLSSIPEYQHAPLPPKCHQLGSTPQSFSFRYLDLWTRSWVHQRAWGFVNNYMRFRKNPYWTIIQYIRNSIVEDYGGS